MVLQKNELFSGTIKENLRWGNENATDEEIEQACILACADEFIQDFPDKYDTLSLIHICEFHKICKKNLKRGSLRAKIYKVITGGPLGAVCV